MSKNNRFMTMIQITGPSRLRSSFIRKSAGRVPKYAGDKCLAPARQCLSFHSLVPVPANLIAQPYNSRARTGNGHDWELAHWGCGRGAVQSRVRQEPGALTYFALTCGGPPTKFVEAVSKLYPGLNFDVLSIDVRSCEEIRAQFSRGRRRTQVK